KEQVARHIREFVAIDWLTLLVVNAMEFEKEWMSILEMPRDKADAAIRNFDLLLGHWADHTLYGVELLKAIFADRWARDEALRKGEVRASGEKMSDIRFISRYEDLVLSKLFCPMLLSERSLKEDLRKQTLHALEKVDEVLCEVTEDPERQRRYARLALAILRRII